MEDIGTRLMEELENNQAFLRFSIGSFPVEIPKSVVVTWIIMAVLVLASILLTRGLKIMPGKVQCGVETVVSFLYNFFYDILGEKGKRYIPYLSTVMIYLVVANIIGVFGITPPTKDLNVTAGLAILSILLIEGAGIRARGMKGWLKSFAEPIPLIAPLNLLEIIIRPLSLCMRLFGNVLGAFVVMELIKIVLPPVVPVAFSFYFDFFDGCIQAYVFVFLTSLFIKEAIE